MSPPTTRPDHRARLRVAFYGRVARDDQPAAAIARQLHVVLAALPTDALLVGCYADVGPGSGLGARGRSTTGWNLDGHPVRGGVDHLLAHAASPERDVDVVACADLNRLARRTLDSVRINSELAACGVCVLTPHDPVSASPPITRHLPATPAPSHWWAQDPRIGRYAPPARPTRVDTTADPRPPTGRSAFASDPAPHQPTPGTPPARRRPPVSTTPDPGPPRRTGDRPPRSPRHHHPTPHNSRPPLRRRRRVSGDEPPLTTHFTVTLIDGERGRHLALIQARAIREVLTWWATHNTPNTSSTPHDAP
ncbi:MAG: recombinase family protein [Pseudonocardiaceae bacterium]